MTAFLPPPSTATAPQNEIICPELRILGLPGNWALYFFSWLWYKFEDRNLPLHQKCEEAEGRGGDRKRGAERRHRGGVQRRRPSCDLKWSTYEHA